MIEKDSKILVVDDDPYLLSLLSDTLKAIGYSSVCANDGVEAIEVLEKEEFDLVITDIKMPRMDGVELLQNIRKLYPRLPVLFITGVASPEIIGQVAPNGFLAKPFRISNIELLIENTLASKYNGIPRKIKKVMVVDDDETFLLMMADSLLYHNYLALTITNGGDALERIKEEEIDVVITDIRMPNMDGITLLKSIKELKPKLPVILITGFLSQDDVKNKLMNFTADGFLEKPFEIEQIVEILKRISYEPSNQN